MPPVPHPHLFGRSPTRTLRIAGAVLVGSVLAAAATTLSLDGTAGPALAACLATLPLLAILARREGRSGRDPLSGLVDRRTFCRRIDREIAGPRAGHGLTVMFIDLDRFAEINHAFGHAAGDGVIRGVAARLAVLTGRDGLVARIGGDLFGIVRAGPEDDLPGRVLDALAAPFPVAGRLIPVGASVGVARAPSGARDRDGLMRQADTALHHAKRAGRGCWRLFAPSMAEEIERRNLAEAELRHAIGHADAESDTGLRLVYQPVHAADGRLAGVEALVRWQHPARGLVGPDAFVPLAEERGLIGALGEWVLRRACTDARRWPGLTVAVNVSPTQMRRADFVEGVARVLARTGLDPARLELEITETVVIDDADRARAALGRLRALGVRVALDDFGTGYSSLIYLRRFAFHGIKIDRSFLEPVEAEGGGWVLVDHIIRLGHALGMTVTAEGVETAVQRDRLRALGCDRLQGFLFSAPVPAAGIDALTARPDARTEARTDMAGAL